MKAKYAAFFSVLLIFAFAALPAAAQETTGKTITVKAKGVKPEKVNMETF